MKCVRSITFAVGMPIALSACYSYRPAQLETIPPGQDVRMVVTRQGRLNLPEEIEPEGPFITGRIVRRDADRLFLSIPVAQQQRGFYVSQIEQEVSLPTGEIVQIELRKLDSFKTGLFVAGTAAAAVGIVLAIIEAGSRNSDGRPPPVEEFRIPLISIPVR